MRGLQKNALKKWSRKGMSLVLVAAMVLTLIPETAYAAQTDKNTSEVTTENNTEVVVENVKSDTTELDTVENDAVKEEGNSSVQYTVPEKWKALNYALFTSGEEEFSLNTSEAVVIGDIHTNSGFHYRGSTISVDGLIEAGTDIQVETAGGSSTEQITSKAENAGKLDMPVLNSELNDYINKNGIVYDKSMTFNCENLSMEKPVRVEGDVSLFATTFLGQGIMYAKDSVTYNVGNLATPEDSRLFVASENGNITLNGADINLNAVLYAPNGTVTINTARLNLNGRIIAKKVILNGSVIHITKGEHDLDMLDFLFKPEIDLEVKGNQKENRKVTIDIKEIQNTEYIIKEATVWNVIKEGTDEKECYAVDSDASNDFHKEMIFREAGTYVISVTVTTGKAEYTVTKTLVIEEDVTPVAGFMLEADYYSRDGEGKAVVHIRDTSFSPDGDTIGKRVWSIFYDADNNGVFAEEERQTISEENETEINFTAEQVGKYKVQLEVTETFSDTIEKLLPEDAFKKDDTSDKVENECVFEVGNEAPEAHLDIAKSKSVDIVFTVGDTDKETLAVYNAKAEALKTLLAENGVDAKIEAVTTSSLTAQDTFAWKEYDHYNYEGYEKHIIYDNNDIRMVGYNYTAMKDFLYVADDNSGKKTFEFDLQRDNTDWHSMEGGGFLFNTTVNDEKDTIQGFCILVTQSGLKLVQIDCNRLTAFRNGSYNWVQYAGKLLGTFSIGNVYDNHHFKIVTDKRTVSVWDGEKLVIDHFVLPENDYGYGYGPIISHASHGCWQRSYFTFKNIVMESMTGSSLSDIVSGYEWRPGASHYVVNLSNTEVYELSSDEGMADLAAALIKNEAAFIGLGNDKNEEQYKGLLNATETGGMYLPAAEGLEEINDYIKDSVLAKEYGITDYITTDDIVEYKGYYQDAENDELYEQKWEYEYDPSVFGGSGEAEHIVKNEDEPITSFSDTGAYSIRLSVMDNPAGENEALSSYRKWSGTEEYEKLLIVQSRPIASVAVTVAENAEDKTFCIANAEYSAEDKDHLDDSKKGIREEYFWYKNIKDGSWTEGKLPNKLLVGETYLVKYQVKDAEGTLSFPATAVVKTGDLLVYKEIEDTTPPEVFIDAAKQEIRVGEELRIDGYALDDFGVDTFEMYIDGEKVLDTFGRTFYIGKEEGTITVKAVATNIGGNTSEKELTISVADDRDKIAPTAEITAPNTDSDIGFNVQIRGTATDETAFSKYTLSYREEQEKEYHVFKESENAVRDDILGTLDITDFTDGNYEILLTVEDAAGNKAYYGIMLYIQTGVNKGYTLSGQISDIQFTENEEAIVITGSAGAEGHMKNYTLSYVYDNEEPVVIKEGTEEVTDGVLGSISTEGLRNGHYNLQLLVEDTEGNSGSACAGFIYTEESEVLESDVNAPDAEITGLKLTEDGGSIDIRATVKDDKELAGYTLSFAKENGEYTELLSGTEELEDMPVESISTEVLEDGNYMLRLQAWDTYENTTTYTVTFTYKKGSGLETGSGSETETPPVPVKKNFAVNLSYSAAPTGTEVQVQVTLPDNVKEETVKVMMGETLLSEGSKTASFVSEKAGKVTITATGVTDEGEEVFAEASCTFYNLLDKNPPTAAITSPTIDHTLTEPVDFVGSAYDAEELDFYRLEYRMKGETDYRLIAEGTEPKKDEVLGHLDTTMLMNGQYEVRLFVQDTGGNIRKLENDYVVEGNLKVGAMHIGFTDITSPVGGTKVSVNRMYDSRNKQKGDFGIGWTLGMQGLEIYENSSLSDGYEMVQSGSIFSTAYQMLETKNHDVTVAYGDGTSDRFELVITPDRKALVPISEVTLGYRCVTNQKIKLEIIGDTTAYVGGSELYFYNENMYNALSYKLTTEDGVKIYIKSGKGVYQIEDSNDNVITVDKDGYHAADGKSITFKRDSAGRIITATDTAGNVTTYSYDTNGDLVTVTDSADRTVTFTYDKEHNLASITDPMGVAVARNEYDDDGRLIATIDADGNRLVYDYDVEGRTQSVKDRRGNTTVYTYDDNGNILQTVDAYGNKTNNTYDEHNNLLSTTDAENHTTSYSYDSSGNVTEVTAADGTKVESTYTQENLVSSVEMLDKTVMALKYDDRGRITSVEDANGNATEYSYTADGKLSGLTDEIGEYQRITYDAEGNVSSTTNGAGESASYTYDKDGRCTSVTISRVENGETKTFTSHYSYNDAGDITESIDNAGNITTYEYDLNGNRTAAVDAEGRRITYSYDEEGNLIKTGYPDGTFESFTYDANGNNLTATDRSGLTVSMTYDKLDRLTVKTYADGTKETYSYDKVGNLTKHVSTSGAETAYAYDSRNRNTSITDVYGNVTAFEYDETARLTKRIDAAGNETSYAYDDNGNIIKTTFADGNSITSEYDERNRIISQKDQNGNETKYAYDGADRLVSVEDAYGSTFAYGYDGNGNMITVTDAEGNVTTYSYDEVGRIKTLTNALGKTMEYGYDKTGNLTSCKDYAGTVITYAYDNMNRLVKKSIGNDTVSYEYSEKGQLIEVTDKSGTVSYGYDEYNRLSAVTDVRGITLSYNYDKEGRLITFDNGFGKTSYEYDLLDRVTKVIDRNGKATVYEYDALGNRSAVRYPNGNVMSYTYDACQRLKEECITNANGVVLSKYTYGLGKAGERLSITEENSMIVTELSYDYDKLNHLVKETIECNDSKLINEYSYDKNSNRTEKKTTVKGDITEIADTSLEEAGIKEGTTTYTYNALNQLVTEQSEDTVTTYTYDDNGNLITQSGDKIIDYSYDKENHLLRATVQKENSVTVESYTYDYAGNRTSKTVNDTDVTYYVNDTAGSLSQVVAETDKDGTETAFYTRVEDLISMEKGSEIWYYLYDGHGSVRLLTNEAGRITDRYAYDAYGNLLKKAGDTENEFLYTGEQYNANTGLYYLRARYMNPSTGTFISMDSYQGSIYDPVSLHKYLYANANPIMYTDPSGYNSNMSELAVGLGCMNTLSIAEAQYNKMILTIALAIIPTLLLARTEIAVRNNYAYLVQGIIAGIDAVEDVKYLAEKVQSEVVATAVEVDEKLKCYTVYTLVDSNGVVRYVGRTKNYTKRMEQHKGPGGVIKKYGLIEGSIRKDNLTYEQARGIEQTWMLYYHTRSWLDEGGYNKINGISEKNGNKSDYYKDTITYFENQADNEYLNIIENIGAWW